MKFSVVVATALRKLGLTSWIRASQAELETGRRAEGPRGRPVPSPVNQPESQQIQLQQALEKNQQWLVYDQQREAYVQDVLLQLHTQREQMKMLQTEEKQRRICALEQQVKLLASEAELQGQQIRRLLLGMSELEPAAGVSGPRTSSDPRPVLGGRSLKCPNCDLRCPVSRHRELLLHMDLCLL